MDQFTDFRFSGQDVPCTTAGHRTLSASTACSLPNPFTPSPGPSTPEQLPVIMGHLHMGCGTIGMGATPPHSNFGANFSPGLHSPQYMNPGFNPYPQQLVTPPVEYAPASYPTDHMNPYDAINSWSWPQEGQAVYFDPNTPGAGTVLGDDRPQSYFSAQERTAALHKVQTRARVTKRTKMPVVMVENKDTETPGLIPAILVHNAQWTDCKLCKGSFNRDDNYRVHLKLHTKKGGRTKYYPEAQAIYDEVMRNTKQRRRAKKDESRLKAEL
ncbi:hypothetical protein F5Y03DRAFT_391286 [Xylaria venustula]|nr:hypothetical protein F5Y03DRAFT_391286 [Xylaria venustula]